MQSMPNAKESHEHAQTDGLAQTRAKATKMRSPSYPGINLETAIKRASGFYQQERRNAAPYSVAASHWGFGAKSSGGLLTVAALKAFGLMVDVEKGSTGRIVQLTDLALRILLDTRTDSSERDQAIKEAALKPRIHAALWKKYGTAEEVSTGNLRHDLIFNWRFNENVVDEFIKEYKETIAFAKLTTSDSLSDELGDKDHHEGDDLSSKEGAMEAGGVKDEQVRTPGGGKRQALENPQISTPVGRDGETVVFAQVQFNAALRKEYIASLKKYLDYLETTLQ